MANKAKAITTEQAETAFDAVQRCIQWALANGENPIETVSLADVLAELSRQGLLSE